MVRIYFMENSVSIVVFKGKIIRYTERTDSSYNRAEQTDKTIKTMKDDRK